MVLFILSGVLATFLAFLSYKKHNTRYLLAALFVIAFIMGFQDSIGKDYEGYAISFSNIRNGFVNPTFIRSDRSTDVELGWYALNKVIGLVFSQFQAVSFVISMIVCAALLKLLKQIDPKYHWLAIFFFYFNPSLMMFFMTGLRQTMAIALFTLAMAFLMEKRYSLAILFSIVAVFFHDSAVYGVLFLLLSVVHYEKVIKNRKGVITMIGVLIFFISFYAQSFLQDRIVAIIGSSVGERDLISGYIQDFQVNEYSFLNMMMRFIFYISAIYAFLNSSKYKGNITLLFFIIQVPLLVILGTSSIARACFYVSLFQVPAICMIVDSLEKNTLLKYSFVIFSCYYCVRIFNNCLVDPQYIGYLNYHTIFF